MCKLVGVSGNKWGEVEDLLYGLGNRGKMS